MLHRALLTDQFSTIDGTQYEDTQIGAMSTQQVNTLVALIG
jgi:hypothetical protein